MTRRVATPKNELSKTGNLCVAQLMLGRCNSECELVLFLVELEEQHQVLECKFSTSLSVAFVLVLRNLVLLLSSPKCHGQT